MPHEPLCGTPSVFKKHRLVPGWRSLRELTLGYAVYNAFGVKSPGDFVNE
jgi:hypothetical protein